MSAGINFDILDLVCRESDFDELRELSLVCRAFRPIAQRYLFRVVCLRGLKHLDAFSNALQLKSENLYANVKYLSITFGCYVTCYHDVLHSVLCSCVNLQVLRVENVDVDIGSIVGAADLSTLSLEGHGSLTDMANVLSKRQLGIRTLESTRLYTIPSLSAVISASPNLTSFNIGPMGNVPIQAYERAMSLLLPKLEQLAIDGWDSFPLGHHGTARPQVERLLQRLPLATRLRHLRVHLHCLHDLLPLLLDRDRLPGALQTLHVDTTSFPKHGDLDGAFAQLYAMADLRMVTLDGYTCDCWTSRIRWCQQKWKATSGTGRQVVLRK